MSVEYRDAFEHLLGQQFRAHAQAHRGPSPLPAQARYQAAHIEDSRQLSIFAKAAALASTKAVVGLIAGVVAVGAAGVSEAVITGSGNPADWVKQVEQQAQWCAISLIAGGEEMAYLRDIEKLIRIALPREDRRTPGHRDPAPAHSQHRGGRSAPRLHAANEAAPAAKGPRRRRRGGGNNGVAQANRHETHRQEPLRPSPQGGGKADGMQGVAFLHRESRPNTRPNRTQRPR